MSHLGSVTLGSFRIYQDKRNQWRWRLRASNGKIVAESGQGYKRISSCVHAVKKLRELAACAPINRLTLEQSGSAGPIPRPVR